MAERRVGCVGIHDEYRRSGALYVAEVVSAPNGGEAAAFAVGHDFEVMGACLTETKRRKGAK
jgi:hypothetical protein